MSSSHSWLGDDRRDLAGCVIVGLDRDCTRLKLYVQRYRVTL